jgi:hypothetical protein
MEIEGQNCDSDMTVIVVTVTVTVVRLTDTVPEYHQRAYLGHNHDESLYIPY